jgi:hypothetical protein
LRETNLDPILEARNEIGSSQGFDAVTKCREVEIVLSLDPRHAGLTPAETIRNLDMSYRSRHA